MSKLASNMGVSIHPLPQSLCNLKLLLVLFFYLAPTDDCKSYQKFFFRMRHSNISMNKGDWHNEYRPSNPPCNKLVNLTNQQCPKDTAFGIFFILT